MFVIGFGCCTWQISMIFASFFHIQYSLVCDGQIYLMTAFVLPTGPDMMTYQDNGAIFPANASIIDVMMVVLIFFF